MRAIRNYVGECNGLPSCTDPSQNIELRVIVDRFVKGLPIPTVGRVLTPDDFDSVDNDYCPPESLDISEVKDMVDKAQSVYDSIKARSVDGSVEARSVDGVGADSKVASGSSVEGDS